MTFDEFWEIYPRKDGAYRAFSWWQKLTDEELKQVEDNIQAHINFWTLKGTSLTFIPMAGNWLAYKDFQTIPEMPLPQREKVNWWDTERGVIDMGVSVHLPPRPGESLSDYKIRITNALIKTT